MTTKPRSGSLTTLRLILTDVHFLVPFLVLLAGIALLAILH
ncbi:translocated intimin receptor Tir [Acidipila sp. EB88]|nr:translocated intimin receptor Tir [Acidipila sp. EB88]